MNKFSLIVTSLATVLNVSFISIASGNDLTDLTNTITDAVSICEKQYGKEGESPDKEKLKFCLRGIYQHCMEKVNTEQWCRLAIRKTSTSF